MDANQIQEATQKLTDQLRRARQTQWAGELDAALAAGIPNNQMMGDIIMVLRRLNNTNLPGMLGASDAVSGLIVEIEKFFKTKK